AATRRGQRTASRLPSDRTRGARRTTPRHLRDTRRDLPETPRQRDVADGERHLRSHGRRVARRRRHSRSARTSAMTSLTIVDRSRPATPGYFRPADEGSGLLDWEETAARFAAAKNYWIGTASASGRPHAMPVW